MTQPSIPLIEARGLRKYFKRHQGFLAKPVPPLRAVDPLPSSLRPGGGTARTRFAQTRARA